MIEIKNASFRYKGSAKDDIKNISLKIKEGETILLCGASGCGKTTITRLINGLIPHYYRGDLRGDTYVKTLDIKKTELYQLAGLVGSVFQNPRSQFFSIDTDGEIVFGLENIGLPVEEIKRRKENIVKSMSLENLIGRSLFQLSGGEKQKIACASVAALNPQIILLDEPSSNLDWHAIDELKDIIIRWKKEGKTIVISEHRLWYLKDVIDKAVYMENGEIVKTWDGKDFIKLSEEELAKMQLRPVNLELKYIKQFADDSSDKGREEVAINKDEEIIIRNFYFSYEREKYFFVKKPFIKEKSAQYELAIPEIKLQKNSITAIIGNNGAGKSTFLRCLCGLEKDCKGEIEIGGELYKGKSLVNKCYMVMQDVNHQLFTDSVDSEVLLSMNKENVSLCEDILTDLGLIKYKEKHPMALSGGQKQRVAIASAIAAEAELLLFDEPTSGLDYSHMCTVAELLKKLAKQGKTILVSTHDPELIKLCCTHVIRIEKGEISSYTTI